MAVELGPGDTILQNVQAQPVDVRIAGSSRNMQIQVVCGEHCELSWRSQSPLRMKRRWQIVHANFASLLDDLEVLLFLNGAREGKDRRVVLSLLAGGTCLIDVLIEVEPFIGGEKIRPASNLGGLFGASRLSQPGSVYKSVV